MRWLCWAECDSRGTLLRAGSQDTSCCGRITLKRGPGAHVTSIHNSAVSSPVSLTPRLYSFHFTRYLLGWAGQGLPGKGQIGLVVVCVKGLLGKAASVQKQGVEKDPGALGSGWKWGAQGGRG